MWWLALAGVGAGIGMISYLRDNDKKQKEIDRQRSAASLSYNYQKEYSDSTFALQRDEALKTLGIQRDRLAEAFDTDLEGFNLGLEGQALQNHTGNVSLADSAGMALAAQGASGTRGSDTLQKQIDFRETQFARQTDLQNRDNSLAIQSMTRQHANQLGDIGREEDSWKFGGYRYNAKTLSDEYAKNMFDLQMDEYDHAYKESGFDFLDFMTAGFSGASSGMSLGNSIDKYYDNRNKNAWNNVGKE